MISRGKGNLKFPGKNWKNVNMVLHENLKNVVHIKSWDFKQCFENFKRLAIWTKQINYCWFSLHIILKSIENFKKNYKSLIYSDWRNARKLGWPQECKVLESRCGRVSRDVVLGPDRMWNLSGRQLGECGISQISRHRLRVRLDRCNNGVEHRTHQWRAHQPCSDLWNAGRQKDHHCQGSLVHHQPVLGSDHRGRHFRRWGSKLNWMHINFVW